MRQFVLLTILALFSNFVYADEGGLGDYGRPSNYESLLKNGEEINPSITHKEFLYVPERFDWRDYGVVSPAKDQGSLGSCWAFAVVGVIEGHWSMLGNNFVSFSEQRVIDCASRYMRNSMNAFDFFKRNRPISEECDPYLGFEKSCVKRICPTYNYRIRNYYTVRVHEVMDVKKALLTDGPGYFSYMTRSDFKEFWRNASRGEVYKSSPDSKSGGGHAVLLIGWDDYKEAWLCKNSWGDTGPEGDGTFWIAWGGHSHDLIRSAAFAKVEHRYAPKTERKPSRTISLLSILFALF